MPKRSLTLDGSKTKAAIYAGVVAIALLIPLTGISNFYIHTFNGVFIFIILSSSLRLISLSGQISIGQAGFMSIGAYISAILAKDIGWNPWLTVIIGTLGTFAIAFLVGIPFTRARGIYFSMISLFFGIGMLAIEQVFSDYTGGYSGIRGIPSLLGDNKIHYYYFFLIVTVVCLFIMWRLEHSRLGLTWKAIAQSYPVASSAGINEAGQRILCLAIGCLFTGLAGALYAHYYQVLSQNSFNFTQSMYLFIYVMVGGVSSFAGPIIGSSILIISQEAFRSLQEYVPFIFGGIMLVVVFVAPQGIAGLPAQIRQWINSKQKDKVTISKGVDNRAP